MGDRIEELSPRPMAAELTIDQAAKLYHVTPRTLRFYESHGLISPRRDRDRRFYSNEVCNRLEMILQGKSLRFSIVEIKEILSSVRPDESFGFEHLLSEQQILAQIEYLEQERERIDGAITRLSVHINRVTMI